MLFHYFLLPTSPPAYGKYLWEKRMGLEWMYSFDYLLISSFKSNLNTETKSEQEGKRITGKSACRHLVVLPRFASVRQA